MKNLLAFIGAALVTVVALGWYLDWYQIRTSPWSSGGHQNVNIDINRAKIDEDLKKGEDKVHDVLDKGRQETAATQAATQAATRKIEMPQQVVPPPPPFHTSEDQRW